MKGIVFATALLVLSYGTLPVGLHGQSADDPTAEIVGLPYDLPLAPGTRIVERDQFLSAGDEIVEWYGSMATTGSVRDVVLFYDEVLREAGFRVSVITDEPPRHSISGRKDGNRVQITSFAVGVDLLEGETEFRISGKWLAKP